MKEGLDVRCRSISLADRLTMLPLLYSILDYDRSPASYERYDKMSAWELFQRYLLLLLHITIADASLQTSAASMLLLTKLCNATFGTLLVVFRFPCCCRVNV